MYVSHATGCRFEWKKWSGGLIMSRMVDVALAKQSFFLHRQLQWLTFVDVMGDLGGDGLEFVR